MQIPTNGLSTGTPAAPGSALAFGGAAVSVARAFQRAASAGFGLALVACVLLPGCGEDEVPAGTAAPLSLADGTQVHVAADGGVSLVVGRRTTFATAEHVGPAVHRFVDSFESFPGLWTFTRANESVTRMEDFAGARQTAAGVEVRYASQDGSAQATLTISVERPGESTRLRLDVQTREPATSLAIPARCDAGGGFYGFGEQYNGTNQRNEAFTLFVSEQGIGRDPSQPVLPVNGGPHTTYFPMPYYLDPRGFGVLVKTGHRVDVDLCRSDPAAAWLEVVSGEPLELIVFHGPTMLDVIRQLGDHIGRPKAPPDWAYGLWVAAQGGGDAVRAKADALRAADVPARVLWVQDWTGLRRNLSGGFGVQYRWTADDTYYPNLAGLIAELKQQGFRFLAYVNPFVDKTLGHYTEMAAAGLLIRNQAGQPLIQFAPNGRSSEPDLTNPAAAEYVKGFLRAMVRDLGMDGWMADFGEWLPLDAHLFDGSDPMVAHNTYPEAWQRLSRAVLDDVHPNGDWVMFARSGFTGVQSVSQIHWTGDQETSFSPDDGLPTVVPALLNLGLSGVPFVTHDIGGFSSVTAARTKEVLLRWTELGAFTPIMRTHEGDKKTENWQWDSDAETVAHFRRFALIHEALGPDFKALAATAAHTSAPILRHLMLVFPDDPRSRTISDEFIIGDALLVAPVLEQGATKRAVYLPPDTWYDVWSGQRYTGAATVDVDAPIGRPPVFSRGVDRADLRAIS